MAFSSLEELSTGEKCLKNIKVCQTFLNVSCSSLLPLKKEPNMTKYQDEVYICIYSSLNSFVYNL